jgi:hypothetical protein
LPPKLKPYVIPIVFSAGFVLLSPLSLFAIFLAGDSCCGQNTSGTMIAVTAGIVVLLSGLALLLNAVVKLILKRDSPDFRVRTASLITAGPAVAIHTVFVAVVSATAF